MTKKGHEIEITKRKFEESTERKGKDKKVDFVREKIEVKKQGDRLHVYDSGMRMATYSYRTNRKYGTTKYFKYLNPFHMKLKEGD